MSRARAVILLTLICALGFLPGIVSIPPLDRDEARFAQATKQMLQTGDYVRIYFQDDRRNKKPAGIHWLQAASVSLLNPESLNEIWAYRVPSVLGAWIAVLGTFALGTRLFGRQVGFIGAAMLACSLVLIGEAHQAKTDAVLLATVVLAQLALARAVLAGADETPGTVRPPGWGNAVLFWSAIGVSTLIKGPVGPFVVLLTILAVGFSTRRWRWFGRLRPTVGIPLALAIALPWYVAVSLGDDAGFIRQAASEDLIAKLISGQETHGAWPGTYLLLSVILFWPASLYAPAAVVAAWRVRATPPVRFCLAWLIPGWIAFELVPTKLPHYVLPMLPALALLTAAYVSRSLLGGTLHRHWTMRLYAVLWALVTLALAGGLYWAVKTYSVASPQIVIAPAAFIVAAGLATFFVRGERARLFPVVALLAGGAYLFLGQFVVPQLDRLWTSRTAYRIVTAEMAGAPPIASVGYGEPSLVFLLGTHTLLTGPDGAAAHLAQHPKSGALVDRRFRDAFLAALAKRGLKGVAGPRFDSFNYSRGDPITLILYRVARQTPR